MAHQYGLRNVVSVLGTALTEQHVAILRRFADRIVLLFDPDSAGDSAVDRAVSLFLTQPIEIAIASLPDDLDPDEFVMKNGAEAFEGILSGAADALTFKWKQMDRQFRSADGVTGQQKALEAYLNVIASAAKEGTIDHLRWGPIVKRLERLTGLGARELERRIRPKRPERNAPLWASAPRRMQTAQDRAEIHLLGSLLLEPQHWHEVQHSIDPDEFSDEIRRRLADIYWRFQQDEGEPVFNQFLGELNDPALSEMAIAVVEEVEILGDPAMTLAEAMKHFQRIRREREYEKQEARLRRTEGRSEEQDEISLLRGVQEKARQPNLRRVV